jgi:hypothetical protein
MYKGVQMRSRLEVAFALYLDRLGEKWKYEPAIYGPRGEGYLPDFQILGSTRPTFIEVKPNIDDVKEAKARMEIIWDTYPDAILLVACAELSAFFEGVRDQGWRFWFERWEHQ